jgi:hypothetical protein
VYDENENEAGESIYGETAWQMGTQCNACPMRLIMHTLHIIIPAKKARNGSGLDGLLWISYPS